METTDRDKMLAPFPASQIQQLPKGGTKLDYVSHGNVTRRLLEVDPNWNWEPLAFDDQGLPLFDDHGGLWIRLTVCGVTRLGYGEPQGSDRYDMKKGAVGNAIRVAAMRFGIALDLWAKESPGVTPDVDPWKAPTKPMQMPSGVKAMPKDKMTDKQVNYITRLFDGQIDLMRTTVDQWKADNGIEGNLTSEMASRLIEDLKGMGYTYKHKAVNPDAD